MPKIPVQLFFAIFMENGKVERVERIKVLTGNLNFFGNICYLCSAQLALPPEVRDKLSGLAHCIFGY